MRTPLMVVKESDAVDIEQLFETKEESGHFIFENEPFVSRVYWTNGNKPRDEEVSSSTIKKKKMWWL